MHVYLIFRRGDDQSLHRLIQGKFERKLLPRETNSGQDGTQQE